MQAKKALYIGRRKRWDVLLRVSESFSADPTDETCHETCIIVQSWLGSIQIKLLHCDAKYIFPIPIPGRKCVE